MHALGMAYYPDGAHGYLDFGEVPELEEPTPEDCDLDKYVGVLWVGMRRK